MSVLDEPTEPASSRLDRTESNHWRWFWLAIFLCCLPMVVHYLVWNWQYEQYHFFPLLLIAVTGLAYARFDGVVAAPRGWGSWTAIAIGFVAVTGSIWLDTPWLSSIALVLFASALLSSLSGPDDATLFGLSLPLWLLVRLPLGYDQLLVLRLQSITTQLTSVVLDAVQVPHAVAGNVIQLAQRELFVAEACSGIQSVFTLAFIALLLAANCRRPLILFPIYLVVACVLAVAANVIRVSTVAMAQCWFELDLASGWPHDLVGYAALAIGVGLLLSFDQLVVVLIHPIGVESELASFNPLISLWNWTTRGARALGTLRSEWGQSTNHSRTRSIATGAFWMTSSVATILFFASASLAVTRRLHLSEPIVQQLGTFSSSRIIMSPESHLFAEKLSTLTVKSHEVIRDGENPRLGENADVWTVDIDGREAQLVLSQTYGRWHEFCLCYENSGWRLLNREVDSLGQDSLHVASALFTNPQTHWGQLLYAGVTIAGDIIEPPVEPGRLSARFFSEAAEDKESDHHVLMFQLWTNGDSKLDAKLFADVKADFAIALRMIASEVRREQHAVTTADHSDENQSLSGNESMLGKDTE